MNAFVSRLLIHEVILAKSGSRKSLKWIFCFPRACIREVVVQYDVPRFLNPPLPLGNFSFKFLVSSTIKPIVHSGGFRKVNMNICGYV